MPLLQVQNLSKFYGAVPIIREATFAIQPGEKWGLVGRNGSGKTTLFKILTGIEEYDQGEISWVQNARIGYLAQEPEFNFAGTIYEELRGLFKEFDALQDEILKVQAQMSAPGLAPETLNRLVEEFHSLSERFEQNGGYQIEGRIQGVLRGLEFPKERWQDRVSVLSGGERTRLALARILLAPSDILFLDEPTNYLDLMAIEWLEEYLREYKGAILLISHDRYFLDQIVTGIYEIEFCNVKRYRGNYSEFRKQKDSAYQATLKAYQEQQKEVNRLSKFIREADSDAKRKAHSLEKRLKNMTPIARPQQNDQRMILDFKSHQAGSHQVVEVNELTKSFGGKRLFQGIGFTIKSGEKIGLIGSNGVGKTTLLKIILGLEQPDHGWVRLGYEVYPGYFSQLDNAADLTGTPFSQIMAAGDLDNTGARTLLGHFLFRGDDVFKSVADLSGGERRRLGFLKLMLSKANFLILDEPTNHLDLESIEVLEQALENFEGTVFMVSHDRYFLNQLVDRYLVLEAGKLFPVNTYQEYLDWRNRQESSAGQADRPLSDSQVSRMQNKERQRDLKRKQRLLEGVETDIHSFENRQKELREILNDPATHADYKVSAELSRELTEIESRLTGLYQEWEALQEELGCLSEKS
jgi:ATP-binding cassette subfamily F protein 3